ncbi:MAG: protein translocase subunit SecD [Cyanobacteria bacterium SIG30]|nr:protein translocase subunit SecD [Cyanobacteria bacterium SIG30]
MRNKIILFWVIVAIAIFSACVVFTSPKEGQEAGKIFNKPASLGLDLVGGSSLVLEAQTTDTIAKITPDMMDSLLYSIESRVNSLGINETSVRKIGEKRLLVEIPNITDPERAKEFIGETAELEFKKAVNVNEKGDITWASTGLTGKDLKKALSATDPAGNWIVSLEFNAEGSKKFAALTKELIGQPMAIFFNGELKSAPIVQDQIIGGHAQISGDFEYQEVKDMVDLLNAGALPIPAKIIEENSVGPTLGADSINKSLVAGAVGIGCVMLFMIMYYKAPGFIADIALLIYALILFALFKLIPVTLTLAGIAGFILSVGMAVDANILIFERTKEELRCGRSLFTAINSGFDRAFTSIFDSNISTIITCIILYLLGTSIVKGFALTLAIGVIASMFTAITVTRNFMHLVFGTGELKHPALFGLKASEINNEYKASETTKENAKFGVLD